VKRKKKNIRYLSIKRIGFRSTSNPKKSDKQPQDEGRVVMRNDPGNLRGGFQSRGIQISHPADEGIYDEGYEGFEKRLERCFCEEAKTKFYEVRSFIN